MDLVTALLAGGERRFNASLVLVDRYSKAPMSLPCHKDDTAMDTEIMVWNRVLSHTGLLLNLISDKHPKFTWALWKNHHNLCGTKLSLSTAYHPQTNGLEERMIQNLAELIRIFCAYGPDFKASYGLTHDWCTLIPALDLAYKTSIHLSTGKTPEMWEKGWNPRLPYDTLKKELVEIHPTERIFKIILNKARNHANRCIQDSLKYEKKVISYLILRQYTWS
ncbi:hypothetical protein O181_115827 [Austropuccinia psidii MF-1]|uniref:Integrase catalytic domain-containing protein n=1 Tax=Austropuccinia psidii MF-1 TaxID=1389203 RepID=A0A9Q3PXS1_9BASI|nr:hypothetical protein [Austropuccinia psidii MF-1]